MGDLNKAVDRMRYWCLEGNLGYDQSNRWDIREGGECDCSSLVIRVLQEAGFDTGSASYTGNMSANLTARGWKRMPNDGNPQFGDVLLNDTHHTALFLGGGQLGQASIDENGNATGGQAGDQGNETNVKGYYNYPWSCYLRWGGTAVTPSVPSASGDIDTLAQKVINGEFGNGDARRAALGDKYDAVQKRVNEMLTGTPAAPAGASTNSTVPAGLYRIEVDSLNVRSQPTTGSSAVASYGYGDTVYLDGWATVSGDYVWGRYTAYSGNIRYIAVRQISTGAVYASKL